MNRARSVQVLLIAVALLGIGWALAPRSAPPLYDGVGFPDEPYRFVVKPHGAADTKPPTTATGTTDVVRGQAGAVHANSAEQAPQVSVLIPVDRLHAPAGTTRIVIKAQAIAPVAVPAGHYLWSNVYDIGAAGAAVTLANGNPPATLTMRAATAQRPNPVIERYTGTGWIKLDTVPVGRDIYQASLPTLGRYAVIGSKPIDVSQINGSSKNSSTRTGIFIAIGAGVVVVALIVVGVRRRSKGQAAKSTEDM